MIKHLGCKNLSSYNSSSYRIEIKQENKGATRKWVIGANKMEAQSRISLPKSKEESDIWREN